MDDRDLLLRLGAGGLSGDALAREAGITRAAVWKRIRALRAAGVEIEARPGIFRAVAEARSGEYVPGDDLLFLIVAGDIRENVKPALADLLDRIKSEAVTKQELSE